MLCSRLSEAPRTKTRPGEEGVRGNGPRPQVPPFPAKRGSLRRNEVAGREVGDFHRPLVQSRDWGVGLTGPSKLSFLAANLLSAQHIVKRKIMRLAPKF